MGFQWGNFATTEKQADFNKLVGRVRSLGKDFYDDYRCQVPLVITLKENWKSYNAGTRFLYVDGHPQLQRDIRNFLDQNYPDYKVSEFETHSGWTEGDDIEFDFIPVMTYSGGILKGLYGGNGKIYGMENETVKMEEFSFD